jgi:membrane associated rhomboid family serine protease
MIPLKDSTRATRFPWINLGLISINVVVFLHEIALGADAAAFLRRYGLIPAHSTPFRPEDPFLPLAFITSQFIHGSWLHLLGNMLYLYIFGDNVESRLGHARYLLFYLLSGVVAACAQIFAMPHATAPLVGASGAIAGVAGAYLVFFPRARVVTLLVWFVFIQRVEIPAILYLVLWFMLQLYYGLSTAELLTQSGGGIAWWAHIAGFLFGTVVATAARVRGRRRHRR